MKTTRPARNTRRRPSRSAARPPSSRKPPKTSAYALITHCRFSCENPRSTCDRGQRDVHDRDVEHDHELDDAEERERPPLPSFRSASIGDHLSTELVVVVRIVRGRPSAPRTICGRPRGRPAAAAGMRERRARRRQQATSRRRRSGASRTSKHRRPSRRRAQSRSCWRASTRVDRRHRLLRLLLDHADPDLVDDPAENGVAAVENAHAATLPDALLAPNKKLGPHLLRLEVGDPVGECREPAGGRSSRRDEGTSSGRDAGPRPILPRAQRLYVPFTFWSGPGPDAALRRPPRPAWSRRPGRLPASFASS